MKARFPQNKKNPMLARGCMLRHTSKFSTCAFVGLGNMGAHMANNLICQGHDVNAFDLNPKAFEALDAKARMAKSVREAAKDADVVITMLPANAHVLSVYLDEKQRKLTMRYRTKTGIFTSPNALKPGVVMIDSSTVNPAVSKQVWERAKAKNAAFVDAPVSGGVNGAKAGTLTFMVGGTLEDFEKAKPFLQSMGKNIVHCGGVGTGEVAKICNNLVLAISMIGVSEAMNLGIKMGMDRNVLAGIMNTSTARCWSSDSYNPAPGVLPNVPASNEYKGGFGASLMLKDLGLALDAAKDVGAPVPLGSASHALYQTLCQQEGELSKKDFSVVYKFLGGK